MNALSTLDDACVSIGVGAAIRSVIDPLIDGSGFGEEDRVPAEVILASIFLPMLAREDRIAAYLGHNESRVRRMGWRLRLAGIWVGTRLASDCYDEIMATDAMRANIGLSLYCGVARGAFWAFRRADGAMMFCRDRPLPPVHVEAARCSKCWTTTKYGQTGRCVECARRYMRGYFGRSAPL